jgi:TATA-binding protein-associated factor
MMKKFYLEYRMATGYAKDDPNKPIPIINNMEEWDKCKSTKMDVCAKICQHLLTRDDAPDVEFEEGVPIFPPFPDFLEGIEVPKKNRILIYQEFPSLGGLLRQVSTLGFCLQILKEPIAQVLNLYGVRALFIDGRMSFDVRNKIVLEFHKEEAPRVLIFSSVGSAGLNLSIANTIIFMVSGDIYLHPLSYNPILH